MEQTQPPLPSDWRERLAAKWYGLKLADTALQVDKDTRRQLVTEHAIRKAYDFATGVGKTVWPEQLGDDMAVSVGDTTNVHHHAPPAGNTVGKLALGAALLASGAGAGVALAPLLLGGNDATPPPAVDTDTNTRYEFGLGRD